jgi:hypothetical protein
MIIVFIFFVALGGLAFGGIIAGIWAASALVLGLSLPTEDQFIGIMLFTSLLGALLASILAVLTIAGVLK